mmetsp:Transcript_21848/g.60715  ORF Transcript_21848/g.60715 Transcript_21848/m.60715 type:complete len:437 (-) Transcript_21848:1210-2520(-)
MNNDAKGENSASGGSAAASGKKAVHVKWAGKTIALGTFPSQEADEKCARAKALTRAWRSTMRPKPTREWVMQELERLGVRVVSGRLGRKAGDEDDTPSSKKSGGPAVVPQQGMQSRKDSLGMGFAELDNLMQQRRNSSLGLSMLNDDMNRRSSLGLIDPPMDRMDGGNNGGEPPHRPYVGGGAGAAFEAARADHYAQKREEQQRRASGLGLGGMGGGPSNMPPMGLSVNPNQHYEMLKLHHMNLLNEIQETTLMMNLYQQQQLQQQQQQLQQQQANDNSGVSAGNDHMPMPMMMRQENGGGNSGAMDGMYNSGGMNQGGSNGMNSSMSGNNNMGMGNHQMMQNSGSSGANASSNANDSTGNNDVQDQLLKSQEEQKALEDQLRKLKDDIAKSKKEAKELKKLAGEKVSGDEDTVGAKRKADSGDPDSALKKMKTEK